MSNKKEIIDLNKLHRRLERLKISLYIKKLKIELKKFNKILLELANK